jgi:hypothetical protein
VRHNFNHACRVTARRVKKLGETELMDQIQKFGSLATRCPCGETIHLSQMYHTEVPCCHMLRSGAARPKLVPVQALLIDGSGPNQLVCRTYGHQRVRGRLPADRIASLKKQATGTIHHSSRTKQKKVKVGEWVESEWTRYVTRTPAVSYMLGMPDNVLKLILDGVHIFARQ